MFADIAPIAVAQGGYLFRKQPNAMGVTDPYIRLACRQGSLTRVRHGTYVPTQLWSSADAGERLASLTRSVLDKLGPSVVASHASAAALWGLDLFSIDPTVVHVTRIDGGSGRSEAGVVFHENHLAAHEIQEHDGRLVTTALRAVVETAATATVEAGMVTGSSALREQAVTKSDLEAQLEGIERWPGAQHARLAVRMSDGKLETVGEVRSLHMMWQYSIPRPELQREIQLPGDRRAFLDFLWEHYRHCGEFDGLVKYGRLNPYSTDIGRVLADEKRREDEVRAPGRGMSRWIWPDLSASQRPLLAARIQQGLQTSRRLYCRDATHIDIASA